MKITVFGAGYVGTTLAALFSVGNEVCVIDIDEKKVSMINADKFPVNDGEIHSYLDSREHKLYASTDPRGCADSDYVFVCTPTDYNSETGQFNTTSVENVIESVRIHSPESVIVIKSTVPTGFTEQISRRISSGRVLFSPEFLREGNAMQDTLHPSRIVIGIPDSFENEDDLLGLDDLFRSSIGDSDCPIIHMGANEAESVKLFSNTYLALRISFFNELDSYAETKGLNVRDIINGVCLDPRIGAYYNNPSFGYGGYCLPKDSKQLRYEYGDVPNSIIGSVVESNRVRKRFVSERIMKRIGHGKTVGAYRLVMKKGSDNFRESSIVDVINLLVEQGVHVIIYEPLISREYMGMTVVNDLKEFIGMSDVVITNRMYPELEPFKDKVYCRDVYGVE